MPLYWIWGSPGIGSGLAGSVIICIYGARNWGRFLPETAQGAASQRVKPQQCACELCYSKGSPQISSWNIIWKLVKSIDSPIPLQTSWVRTCRLARFQIKFEKCYTSESWDFDVKGYSCWNLRVRSPELQRDWERKRKFKLYKTTKNNSGTTIYLLKMRQRRSGS